MHRHTSRCTCWGYRVCEHLSTESHHREGLRGLPQLWSPELTGRKRYRACDDGLRRGWSRVSRGSGWVRKELGRQGQSAQGLMGWILFWKQWMFESYAGSVWVFGKHNMPLVSDSGFTGRVQALNQIPGRGFARPSSLSPEPLAAPPAPPVAPSVALWPHCICNPPS